ncbi:MAG: type I-F CRISPR-associated protein Csy1 [Sulfurovum sp.]
MANEVITKFFDERKEAWLKKKLNPSMEEDEVLELYEESAIEFSLEVWLPNASKRAGQISMATHPCTFSHPSARKNKNGYVTSIIASKEYRSDGLLRTGNVKVQSDALGNAAALDVHKFLNLIMPDGKVLIEHIQQDTPLAKSLLNIKSKSYDVLKDEFLEMIESSSDSLTSSKIKQVYFPVDEDYHLLSILSNSGIIYHLRKRLDSIRFGADEDSKKRLKELRVLRNNAKFSEDGFPEIYNLTTIGYGGTKPQNISVLNSQNGGKAQLLNSMPPNIEKRDTHFPKSDFFAESMKLWRFRDTFMALHKIYKVPDYTNIDIRNAKKYHYETLIEKIIEQMWAVRAVSDELYYEKTSTLKSHQKIWLLSSKEEQREDDDWLDKVIKDITSWIIQSYPKLLGKNAIEINAKWEFTDIKDIVEKRREALR